MIREGAYAAHILEKGGYKKLVSSRYVNDKQITDHYAIIPTGQGLSALKGVSEGLQNVYEIIVRRFLSIFLSGGRIPKNQHRFKNRQRVFLYK